MLENAPLKLLCNLTALLLTGEALALLIGMVWLSPTPNPWVIPKNLAGLALDLFCGFSLLALLLGSPAGPSSLVLLRSLAGLAAAAHLYRALEALAGWPAPFLTNPALFVVNLLKLAGLLVMLARRNDWDWWY
jgi:hypothetical protein